MRGGEEEEGEGDNVREIGILQTRRTISVHRDRDRDRDRERVTCSPTGERDR